MLRVLCMTYLRKNYYINEFLQYFVLYKTNNKDACSIKKYKIIFKFAWVKCSHITFVFYFLKTLVS